jgi:hypothetical protein
MKRDETHVSIRGIDRKVWREFHIECLRRDLQMGETINQLILAQLRAWEPEKGPAGDDSKS